MMSKVKSGLNNSIHYLRDDMESRFRLWISCCMKNGELSNEEIKGSRTDDDTARMLFQEFTDYDSTAVVDFVRDCMEEIQTK